MGDLLGILYALLVLLVVLDVAASIRGRTEKALWLAAVILVPFAGPAAWYYIQYQVPAERRRARRAGKLDG